MPAARASPAPTVAITDFEQMGTSAVAVVEKTYYAGDGLWNSCATASGGSCGRTSRDWGVDSMIYALYLRWMTTKQADIPPILSAMQNTSVNYVGNTTEWSDVPVWDSIADSFEYQVLSATGYSGDAATALAKAQAGFNYVDADPAHQGFASGACPAIDFQLPHQGGGGLKTLETDSNYIKAALQLYAETGNATYLAKAQAKYAAVRQFFFVPSIGLYTVYVFDNGSTCSQVPQQFFSSVNGNMLENSYRLGVLTGNAGYLADASAELQSIVSQLSDATGVFESLQQENDTGEEMVEAMWTLATSGDASFAPAATSWIQTNAAAAGAAIAANGVYGRFFGGMAPLVANPPSGRATTVSLWQSAGGLALAFAASAVVKGGQPNLTYWSGAKYTAHDQTLTESNAPQSLTFDGKAISILGTMGESGPNGGGHVYVALDGKPLVNQVGIDQQYSETGQQPNTILFAWRWPATGSHTITFSAPPCNVKQGCPYFHMTGYYSL